MLPEAGKSESQVFKKNIYLLVRIAVSLFLILFLLFKINWTSVFQVFASVDFAYLIIFFLVSFIMTAVSCRKWQILLQAQEINVSLSRLILLYHVGYFFNNFMPSNVGGDLIRGFEVAKFTNKYSESFVSVFMERFTGFTALLLFAILALVARVQWIKHPLILPVLLVAIAGYLVFLWLIYDKKILYKLKSYLIKIGMRKIEDKLGKIYNATIVFKEKKVAVVWSLYISIIFYILTIINVYIASRALNIKVQIMGLVLVVPIVLLIAAIPVSLNGLGVSEVAYVYYFSLIGISEPRALSIALLLRAKVIILSIIGGLIFIFLSRMSKKPDIVGNIH